MTAPRDPYSWVESWAWPVIEQQETSTLASLLLLRLAAHANRDGIAWPSARHLGEMIGRSERRAREGLEQLRDLGLIDGSPQPRKVTRWRLITDSGERHRLRQLRTQGPQASAETGSAARVGASADHLQTICSASADPVRDEGEGEGEETPFAPSRSEARGAGEMEFDPHNLIPLRRIA